MRQVAKITIFQIKINIKLDFYLFIGILLVSLNLNLKRALAFYVFVRFCYMKKLSKYFTGALILGGIIFAATAQAVVTPGINGGTGISTSTPANDGKCLTESSSSPFLTWTIGTCGSGGTVGPSTSTFVAVFNSSGTITGYAPFTYTFSTNILTIGTGTIQGSGSGDSLVMNGASNYTLLNGNNGWGINLQADYTRLVAGGAGNTELEFSTDNGISRDAANVLDVGNGTYQDKSGSINLANINGTGNVTSSRLTLTGLGSTSSPCLNVSSAGVVATTTCVTSQVATTSINGTQAASFFIVGTGVVTTSVVGATTTFSCPSCLTTSTFNATGTQSYFPLWGIGGTSLTATSGIFQTTSTNFIGFNTTTPTAFVTIQSVAGSNATELSVVQSNVTGTSATALNFNSSNASATAVQISGKEFSNPTLSITHSGASGDLGASVLSLNGAGVGTAAQGIIFSSVNGTQGNLINFTNGGNNEFIVSSSGVPTFGGLTGSGNPCLTVSTVGLVSTSTCLTAQIATTSINGIASQAFILQGDGISVTSTVIGSTTIFSALGVAGDANYYFTSSTSDLASNLVASDTPWATNASTTVASLSNGTTSIQKWSTATNVPSLPFIPAGIIDVHIDGAQTAGTKPTFLYAVVLDVSSAGAIQGTIATTETSTVLTGSTNDYDLLASLSVPYMMASTTDRIQVNVIASVSGVLLAPTVQIYYGGSSADSRLELPAQTADVTNFIPYVGAIKAVNLGSNAFSTTGLGSFGTLTVTGTSTLSGGIVNASSTHIGSTYSELVSPVAGEGDYTNIQSAINADCALASPGLIFIKDGSYSLGGTGLTVSSTCSGIGLRGESESSTIITYTGSGDAIRFGDVSGSLQYGEISNLKISGSGSGLNAIHAERVQTSQFQNLYLTGFTKTNTSSVDLQGKGFDLDGMGMLAADNFISNVHADHNDIAFLIASTSNANYFDALDLYGQNNSSSTLIEVLSGVGNTFNVTNFSSATTGVIVNTSRNFFNLQYNELLTTAVVLNAGKNYVIFNRMANVTTTIVDNSSPYGTNLVFNTDSATSLGPVNVTGPLNVSSTGNGSINVFGGASSNFVSNCLGYSNTTHWCFQINNDSTGNIHFTDSQNGGDVLQAAQNGTTTISNSGSGKTVQINTVSTTVSSTLIVTGTTTLSLLGSTGSPCLNIGSTGVVGTTTCSTGGSGTVTGTGTINYGAYFIGANQIASSGFFGTSTFAIGTTTLSQGYALNIVGSNSSSTGGTQLNLQNITSSSWVESVFTDNDGNTSTNFAGIGVVNSQWSGGIENPRDMFYENSSTGGMDFELQTSSFQWVIGNVGASTTASMVKFFVNSSSASFATTLNESSTATFQQTSTFNGPLYTPGFLAVGTSSLSNLIFNVATGSAIFDITKEGTVQIRSNDLEDKGGIKYSTSTIYNITGTNGATTTVAGATTTISIAQGPYLAQTAGGALTVSSTLASTTVTFPLYNPTTTAPYSLMGAFSQSPHTITSVNCFGFTPAATATIVLYYTTSTASSSILTGNMIASSTVCGVAGTSTAIFTTSSWPANAWLWVSVSSTAGTPLLTNFVVNSTKI